MPYGLHVSFWPLKYHLRPHSKTIIFCPSSVFQHNVGKVLPLSGHSELSHLHSFPNQRDKRAAYHWLDFKNTYPLPNMPRLRKRIAFGGHLPSPSETPAGDGSIPLATQASPVFFLLLPQHQLARDRSPCRLPRPTENGGHKQVPRGMCPDQSSRHPRWSDHQVHLPRHHTSPNRT